MNWQLYAAPDCTPVPWRRCHLSSWAMPARTVLSCCTPTLTGVNCDPILTGELASDQPQCAAWDLRVKARCVAQVCMARTRNLGGLKRLMSCSAANTERHCASWQSRCGTLACSESRLTESNCQITRTHSRGSAPMTQLLVPPSCHHPVHQALARGSSGH